MPEPVLRTPAGTDGNMNEIATPKNTAAMEPDMQNVAILLSLKSLNLSASSLDAIFIFSELKFELDLKRTEKW